MYLLLIRHGESVDNVAGLYAGSRDSPLTNHGVLQTKRLGAHLTKRRSSIGPIRQVFSSNLQRAYRTAEAIVDAQRSSTDERVDTQLTSLDVVQLPDLREKDFGSVEGKKFGARDRDKSNISTSQSDSESIASMRTRVDRFLDTHLVPTVNEYVSENVAVVVVSHGIILNVLLKALLGRYPTRSSQSHSQRNDRWDVISEYLTVWSNTGVLQAKLEAQAISSPKQAAGAAGSSNKKSTESDHPLQARVQLTIELTDNVDHLQGLKKTKGGIGSAKFDSRQRTMDSFFSPALKKRKLEESND
ncbi:phosphoglycerate mutase-like protein [Biscogniauxia marginata]|nr:phosphoglycerate mutase-like protein [Biscogniauxia marginata]